MSLKKNKSRGGGNHPDHGKELNRINRALGQLEGARRMILEGRYCPEILAVLRAVRAALKIAEVHILKSHLEFCVANSLENGEEKKKKIAEMAKLLESFWD
ncbi:MAG: metal-sensitive transcriptional regulator [Rickettsiales bacterium]|jgi:DNA-binding FrmR family transcriptional regulator|nr:metal-sensitive transcriptional regulator [Rickettsiales bacterium]